MKADVLVIGGGIIGCSIAYYLARAGRKTVLAERRGIGEGTSGACDGFVMLQTKKPGLPLRMAVRSAELYAGLSAELGYETQYRRLGGLVLIETEEMRTVMEKAVAEEIREGVEVSFLNNRETRAVEPLVSDRIAGAVYSKLDGSTSPIYTVRAFAKRFRELGGEILTDTPVTGLLISGGEIRGVKTACGEIPADAVVCAAGVWAPEIAEMAGFSIPIRPRRGLLMVSEALEQVMHCVAVDARYIALKHDPSLAERASADPTFELGVSLSVEQTENGNFLIGSSREFAGFDTNVRLDLVRAASEYALRFFPAFKDVNIIRTFMGMRPYSADGFPVVGAVPGVAGLYLAAGHEGDGICLAPITGQEVANLVCGRKTEFDLTPFSPARFLRQDGSGEAEHGTH